MLLSTGRVAESGISGIIAIIAVGVGEGIQSFVRYRHQKLRYFQVAFPIRKRLPESVVSMN